MKTTYQRIFLFLLLFLFSLRLYAQDIPPDIQHILKRGTLIVAILKTDVPPFHWHDQQGNLQGYDIALAKDMAQRLGVKVAFYSQSEGLNELADDLVHGKADVIMSYSFFTQRAEKVIYSKPQLSFNQVLFVNNLLIAKNKLPLDVYQLLKIPNLSVGTLAGSNFVDILKSKYPHIHVIAYPDIEKAYEAVKEGKIVAVFYVDKLVEQWLMQHPEANLYARVLIIPNKTMPMGMAVFWRNIYFMHWLNTYIEIIETDGTLEHYKAMFFGDAL